MNRLFCLVSMSFLFSGCQEEVFIQKSSSMEPAIMVNDLVSVDMNAYRLSNPRRWDIVVFHPPLHASSSAASDEEMGIWLFRIVGLPGESISFEQSGIVINGQPIEQPKGMNIEYSKRAGPGISDHPRSSSYPFVIPEDHVFVLGDNPMNSNDSRFWGPLSKERILGKAIKNNPVNKN